MTNSCTLCKLVRLSICYGLSFMFTNFLLLACVGKVRSEFGLAENQTFYSPNKCHLCNRRLIGI